MKQALASAIGEFVARLEFEDLPADAVQIAKTGILDCLGVIVAGYREEPVEILRKTLGATGTTGEASLLGTTPRLRAAAPEAAWINGAAGHVLDYDDVVIGHPSVIIVPAIVVEAEVLDRSGADLITAYVAGYETWMDLLLRERGNHQIKGFHPTGVLGALASAAACAKLRRLDAAQTAHALAIAAAQASGIVASYGTMAKSLQVGKASHVGVVSARLAANGMTADPGALDGQRGYLKAISQKGDVDIETPPTRLGREWYITHWGLNIKRYPMCYCAHRTVDAVLSLRERTPLQAEDIEHVEASLSTTHATILATHRPETGLAAKFSVEFAVAASVVAGDVTLKQLSDEFVARRDVQDLIRKVSVVTNDDVDPEEPASSMYDSVRVFLKNGKMLESERVRYARGNARRPLEQKELEGKFLDCISTGNPQIDGKAALELLRRLETLQSCRELTQAL